VLFAGAVLAHAQSSPWRVVGGGFAHRWLTDGEHGHTQACREAACDDADWERGNLDNAIGFRLAGERDVAQTGALRLVAGGELDVLLTEYNSSQRDLALGALTAVGGVDVDLGAVTPLLRAGAGGVAGGGRSGFAWFVEGGLDVRLSPGAALRVTARRGDWAGPRTEDLSLLLAARPDGSSGATPWSVGWVWGASWPGSLAGEDLELQRAPRWRLAAQRGLGSHGDRVGVLLGATSHESELYSDLGGVAGNQRGKWVIDLAARWERVLRGGDGWRWRLGAGAAAGGWSDEGNQLLVDDVGEGVDAGLELAATAHAAIDVNLSPALALTLEAEQAYWPGIELGEARLLIGLEVRL
jgi:opacity protein-like surface antigen